MQPQQQGGQNPFQNVLDQWQQYHSSKMQGGAGGGQPQAAPTPQAPGGAGGGSALQGAMAGAQGAPAGAGGTPGQATKLLSQAIGALNQFLVTANDPQEETIIRGVIKMISQLIQRDMEKQHAMTQGGQPGTTISAQTPAPGTPPPGGAPAGGQPAMGGQPSPMGR